MGHPPDVVCLASAGAIDRDSGIVIRSPNFPDWRDVDLANDVKGLIDNIPVLLENDANAAAVGEGWIGAGKRAESFIMITIGTGIGGGIILDRELWRGATGMAGEIGHINVRPDGRMCGCGRRGCLETTASASGVVNTAKDKLRHRDADWLNQMIQCDPDKITADMIARGAENGDPFCKGLFRSAGEDLGVALGFLALTLDIGVFVIGGGMGPALKFMESAARQVAIDRAFTLNTMKLKIRPATLGNLAGIIGAGKIARDYMD